VRTLVPRVDETPARRRVVAYVGLVVLCILGFTVLYQVGMARLEGVRVGFVESLHVVVEAFTTTGFGEDANRWSTNGMWLLSIAMQITGVVLIFLALPLFLVPFVEESLRVEPPTGTDLTDHVLISGYTPTTETLVRELDSMGVPHAAVVPDRDRAVDLHEAGHAVVHGDPERVPVLERANAREALALVAEGDDETSASVVLSAKQAAPDLRVVTTVEDPKTADYHRFAGADRVVSPRHLLGESLASKAATAVRTDVGDAVEIGDDFEIAELMVQRDSRVVGDRVSDSELADTGATVIGAWFRGEFVSPPRPDDVIDEHTVLLAAGKEAELERLKELTLSETRRHRRGTVVIAGYGEVGSTVGDALAAADVPTVVVDEEDKPGVDVVGDVTDRSTLREAGVDDARSVILAVDDDTTAVFATLAVAQFAPDVEVIVRANEQDSTTKLYRAGAEYVLALATVAGRILASSLLEDEEVIAPDTQIEVVRTVAPSLAGQTLAEADVRARTNCTVIAAERDDRLLTDVGPAFRVEDGDTLIVAGLDADINEFNKIAG
jgi:Trk K+ transport system NAD-binding subunit